MQRKVKCHDHPEPTKLADFIRHSTEEEAVATRQDQEERRRQIDDDHQNPMPQPGMLFSMLDESDGAGLVQIGKRDDA